MTDILIVEDNKELAELLRDFLRAAGYSVAITENGEKALLLYEQYGARLMILDIMLTGIDGFAVCKKSAKAAILLSLLSVRKQKRTIS